MTYIPLQPYKITTDDITGTIQRGEYLLIDNFIRPNHVVFDVGANVGSWTKLALSKTENLEMHLFEPVPQTFHQLIADLPRPGETLIRTNHVGLGDKEEIRAFYHYEDRSSWSTLYRRHEVEKQLNLVPPTEIPVLITTIDQYCARMAVPRINYLKIDTEGGELACLAGAVNMLKRGNIDYIQFEYGGTYPDAGITLKSVFELLQNHNYHLFKVLPDGIQYEEIFHDALEDYKYSNYLAINERLVPRILQQPTQMLDLRAITANHGITPKGVIHIGAHEGKELENYRKLGVNHVLFIEANPTVYAKLLRNVNNDPNVKCLQCAVGNENGRTLLHVTSMDQSSSILPLKKHKEIYPKIQEVEQIEVPLRTLDQLLIEHGIDASRYNILSIDIQGAEFMALQGASQTLAHIELINTEVNYEELYEGCATISMLDELLDAMDFRRVAVTTPYHPSWGDAAYIRKPVVTMSSFGNNGRFANQLFQYAFLKLYTDKFDMRLEIPHWPIGQYLFGVQETEISRQLPVHKEVDYSRLNVPLFMNENPPAENVDFWGYYQYHTKFFRPYKTQFSSLFKPVPIIKQQLEANLEQLKDKTIVAIHLRRGDYGYGHFQVAPVAWYKEWLSGFWDTLDNPVLYIASDDLQSVIHEFSDYNVCSSADFSHGLSEESSFYFDFYVLSQAQFVATSNSSFSHAACMLNESGVGFFRPHHKYKKLIPFDPWNSEILLRDSKEDEVKGQVDELDDNATIIIYGAGAHTAKLFERTAIGTKNIISVVDSNFSDFAENQVFGKKIESPESIIAYAPEMILISSFTHQNAIEQSLLDTLGYSGQIIKLYDEHDKKPFYVK